MKSKASMSFNPIVGFVKAQIHNFLFSALIFTIITVGISFACGSNSLYGYDVENISYNDPRSVGFAVVIMLAAFVFAAFSFKPFLAKNESDTFLSLPIKKSSLLSFQTAFGLVIIVLSLLISFGLIYPALNLTKFTSFKIYFDSFCSIFCEIILPMMIYYMISVILIMRSGNFFSSFLMVAVFGLISFFIGGFINSKIGFSSVGTGIFEITDSFQPYYFSSSILLPTKIITCLIKAILPITNGSCNIYILSNIVNMIMFAVMILLFALSIKSVVLGEMNKPFAIKPMLKTLPIALLCVTSSCIVTIVPSYIVLIIGIICVLICFEIIYLYKNNIKTAIYNALALLIITVIPLACLFTDKPISDKMTYAVPNINDIECIYFDPATPVTKSTSKDYNATYEIGNRYKFSDKESIELILKMHNDILDNIRKYDLINNDAVRVNDELMLSSVDLSYNYDRFRSDKFDNNDYDQTQDEWGMFDKNDADEEYWTYMFDYETATDITPNISLRVVGSEEISMYDEIPTYYKATFYYQLKDGRMFKRLYTPIPVSWIRDDMNSLLQSDEMVKLKQTNNTDTTEYDETEADDYEYIDDYE